MQADEQLALTFLHHYPIEAARLLESMPVEDTAKFFTILPPPIVAGVLQHALPQRSVAILENFSAKNCLEVLLYMSPTAAICLLSQGEPAWQASLLGQLDTKTHSVLLRAFSYPDWSAGRLADRKVLLFASDRTVSDAILWIQQQPTTQTDDLFLLDRQYRMAGRVTMRSLLISDPDSPLDSIMEHPIPALSAECPLNDILASPYWKGAHTLPVLDTSQQAFLGVLRYVDLLNLKPDQPAPSKPSSPQPGHS